MKQSRTGSFLFIILMLQFSPAAFAQHFEASWESLGQYECPEWFRDAKLGIFLHWGPSSVPAVDDWYGRNMYVQGHPAYEYHLKTFGHPSEFGFKDLIPLWKAEHFDPDLLVKLFKKAGAKYIVPVATFHDNFDLWDSQYQRWNAINIGPGKDIIALWKSSALANGLRFGVSTHMDRVPSWFNTSKGSDSTGTFAGVPYDGSDPQYADLYGPENDEGMDWPYLPKNPSISWKEHWALRTNDLISKYQPDLLYFDGGIPYVDVGLSVIANYYNDNQKWNDGRMEAVLNLKKTKVSGAYREGMCVQDLERSKLTGIKREPWQTDTSIGPWFYRTGGKYETPDKIIDMLIDIVSKNGNLLLNIPLLADGTLDATSTEMLNEMESWMAINQEAISGSRPWIIYGEGPTAVKEEYSEKISEQFTSRDIRFTKKDDVLYAICLDWPEDGKSIQIKSLSSTHPPDRISDITLLGYSGTLKWKRDQDGLEIYLPEKKPCSHAFTFKIEQDAVPSMMWDFNQVEGRKAYETSSGSQDTIEGNFRIVDGVNGSALKLDGFTTVVRNNNQGDQANSGSFAVEAWVALGAYPWNWCPVVCQINQEIGGYSFEIGPRGEFGLKMNVAGNFVSCISESKVIPLRTWVHIASVYEEGSGLKIYLNGELSGVYNTKGSPRYANREEIRIGMNSEAVKPSNQIGDTGNKPYWYSLDGIVDELKFYQAALPDSHFKASYAKYQDVKETGMKRRLMPRGPEASNQFKAYYTNLKYYEEWDQLWPVAADPDIVVTFKDSPVRVIFWRGTRYSPAWVTDENQWMCDQSVEAWNDAEGCFEHMQDRHCRYSHVRIIEDTEARKVIHWRYAPVSAYDNLWREDEKTGWAVWVDEYYYIYPDATAIRKISWKTGALGFPRQFQESLPLTNPEQLQGDVLEADYLAVANLEGEIQRFEYLKNPSNAPKKQIPESPNIQQHNFKSPYDPFIIFEPGNTMHYIGDRDIRAFQSPGSCNHWPVGQANCDGRITQAADRPAHFLGFPISDPVIHQEEGRSFLHSIYGMKDCSVSELIEIGKSWVHAPELKIISQGDFTGGAYDMGEKAYLLTKSSSKKNSTLKFTLPASDQAPLNNPAFVIKNWDRQDIKIVLNGKLLTEGKDYLLGKVDRIEGTKLVLWLELKSVAPLEIEISDL